MTENLSPAQRRFEAFCRRAASRWDSWRGGADDLIRLNAQKLIAGGRVTADEIARAKGRMTLQPNETDVELALRFRLVGNSGPFYSTKESKDWERRETGQGAFEP